MIKSFLRLIVQETKTENLLGSCTFQILRTNQAEINSLKRWRRISALDKDIEEQAYLSDYFEEVDVAEAMKRPVGAKIWITGLVVSVSDTTIVLADPTGKLHVHTEDTKSADLQPERTVRVLGRLGTEGHIEGDWIIPLNIHFRELVQIRQLEKSRSSFYSKL